MSWWEDCGEKKYAPFPPSIFKQKDLQAVDQIRDCALRPPLRPGCLVRDAMAAESMDAIDANARKVCYDRKYFVGLNPSGKRWWLKGRIEVFWPQRIHPQNLPLHQRKRLQQMSRKNPISRRWNWKRLNLKLQKESWRCRCSSPARVGKRTSRRMWRTIGTSSVGGVMWENMKDHTKRAHGTVATGKQPAMIPTTKIHAKTVGGHGKTNFGVRWTMMALTNALFATEKLREKKDSWVWQGGGRVGDKAGTRARTRGQVGDK